MHLVSIVQALSLWLLFIASPVHSLEMIALKSSIRQEIKNRLQHVTRESILSQSHGVLEQLFSVPHVQDSRTVCIYLSMQGEVDTFPIIDRCLQMGKTVFIPKVIGKHPEDMRMFHLKSFDQIETFPKNKWGIPEPSLSMINIEEEPYLETIDVVFLPGVAFDSVGGRVGHGKGYYDCFLNRMIAHRKNKALESPLFVGLGLEEQMIDNCPMEPHDRYLHYVVTAGTVIARVL